MIERYAPAVAWIAALILFVVLFTIMALNPDLVEGLTSR